MLQSFIQAFVKHLLYAGLCSKHWEHSKRDQQENKIKSWH